MYPTLLALSAQILLRQGHTRLIEKYVTPPCLEEKLLYAGRDLSFGDSPVTSLPQLRSLGILAAPLMLGILAPAAMAGPLEGYSVGAGVRTGFNDGTSFAIDGKVPLTQFKIQGNGLGVSLRPAVIFGDETELRAAATVDASVSKLTPYGGVGLAYNTDSTGDVSPMLSAGLEFDVQRNAAIRLNGNYIFQDGDTDAELLVMGVFNF